VTSWILGAVTLAHAGQGALVLDVPAAMVVWIDDVAMPIPGQPGPRDHRVTAGEHGVRIGRTARTPAWAGIVRVRADEVLRCQWSEGLPWPGLGCVAEPLDPTSPPPIVPPREGSRILFAGLGDAIQPVAPPEPPKAVPPEFVTVIVRGRDGSWVDLTLDGRSHTVRTAAGLRLRIAPGRHRVVFTPFVGTGTLASETFDTGTASRVVFEYDEATPPTCVEGCRPVLEEE
jgi:hypothetical protein